MRTIEYVNGIIDNETYVKEIKANIALFKNSKEYQSIIDGKAYYRQKNTVIMDRAKTYYSDTRNQAIRDPYKSNHKLPSGFMPLMVKQKVGYSINSSLEMSDIETDIDLEDIGTEASCKAKAYMQVYEKDGILAYKIIPTEQIVPIYQNEELFEIIREYIIDGIEYVTVYNAELSVTFIVKDDEYTLKEIKPILVKERSTNGKTIDTEPLSWGRVPFVVMNNNSICETDLEPIKRLIDGYDLVSSDFLNNLDDFQDVYWILKNYGGEDLNEYLNQIKRYKTIKVGEDGDARAETIQIPVEARKTILELLDKNIYKDGMGLNYDSIKGNVTATEIEAMSTNLDLKANSFEKQIFNMLKQFEYFINKLHEFKGKPSIKPIEIKFIRTTIVNKSEEIESLTKLYGIISNKTFLELLPYDIDVEQELERLKEEEEEKIKSLGGDMGFGDE